MVSGLAVEASLVLLALAFALLQPIRLPWRLPTLRRPVLFVFLLTLGCSLAVRLYTGLPVPRTHDEMSYLLAADTFAHGRLTNPTHPLWEAFESFHINQKPTYMSMYWPAQGGVAALGQVVFGHPWFGVWLMNGAMCAAITWMLRSWLPGAWPLAGGLLAMLKFSIVGYWAASYWGGAFGATAGALAFGALGRIQRRPTAGMCALLAASIAAGSAVRPFETAMLAVPIGAILIGWIASRRITPRMILAMGAVGVIFLMAVAHYNFRLTGDPLRFAYVTNRQQYAVAQIFVWDHEPQPPVYRHRAMRDFYLGWELDLWRSHSTPGGVAEALAARFIETWIFYWGPILSIALGPLVYVWRNRRVKRLAVMAFSSYALMTVCVYTNPHYVAGFTSIFCALTVTGLRYVRTWRRRTGGGVFLVRAVPLLLLISLGWSLMPGDSGPDAWPVARQKILDRLESSGRHLVLVRYSLDHDPNQEWVYNRADIDRARVVWAREMDRWATARVIAYFRRQGREVWLTEPDRDPGGIEPYLDKWLAPAGP